MQANPLSRERSASYLIRRIFSLSYDQPQGRGALDRAAVVGPVGKLEGAPAGHEDLCMAQPPFFFLVYYMSASARLQGKARLPCLPWASVIQ